MNTKTILGILAATAVGVAIGTLIAPQKGSDLQTSIKDSLGSLGDQLGDLISEGKEKIMDEKEEVTTKTNELKEEVSSTAGNMTSAQA